jgi:SAM-dependent methyltransferase
MAFLNNKAVYDPWELHPDLPEFIFNAIRDLGGFEPTKITVLDVGCGRGLLVQKLLDLNLTAYGCDVEPLMWKGDRSELRRIERDPYRIPFADESIEVVITNTILEHVLNHSELYKEIKRVLKPGGCAIHTLPGKWHVQIGKWFLPVEPHIKVPFVNFMWPFIPRWWLALWAFLGVRSPFQEGKDWQATTAANVEFCKREIHYLTHSEHCKLSMKIFGNCEYPMEYFLSHTYGGSAELYHRIPTETLKKIYTWFIKHTRIALLVQRKQI